MLGKRRLYRLGLCVLALAAGMQAGCLTFVHRVEPVPAEEVHDTLEVPTGCKNCVYLFFLDGVDPMDLANFEGFRDYLQSLGYIKTYLGYPFHAFHFETEIAAIHKRDPNARFVLVGFSYGAGLARDLSCSLGKRGIVVDLVVYVDGVRLETRPLSSPPNALRVVNVLAFDRSRGQEVAGAENLRCDDVWHFGTLAHPKTMRMIVRELAVVALRVPVITDAPPPIPGFIAPAPRVLPAPTELPGPQVLPAPKGVLAPKVLPAPQVLSTPTPTPNAKRGGWDFLEPDGHARGLMGAKPIVDAFDMPPASLEQK